MDAEAPVVSPKEILEYLPHRYPFLLVDRVDQIVPNERIVAVKNVTWNEPYFAGHFPGDPVMPGVLQVEAMAQAAAILGFKSNDGLRERGGGVLLMGLDKVRFRRKVEPGDVLRLEVDVVQIRGGTWKVKGRAFVGSQRASEATLLAQLVEPAEVP